MATVSTLEVIIDGDSSRLTSALNAGAKSTQAFQGKITATSKLTKSALGAVVPISAAAAGVAVAAFAKSSIQAAQDFDRAFTQIAAITNTSADAIAGLKEQTLALAGETAQSPVELAHALYFLSSAGLDAAQIQETLTSSAKAAAVGLGQAADIAKITSQALNAYAGTGLEAAHVTDVLVAAVREGSADPNEFATALGRVLPIAAKVGISFDQVAASLATMSNAGLDVNEGVTALRGALQALAAPTAQTRDALQKIGLTADDVRNSLAQNGLIDTLRMLSDRAGGNIDVLRELVPNVRALTGVLNLTGQEAAKVDGIFQSVTNSTGSLDRAFKITAASDSFKLKKALNDIAIAGQELASKVLPDIAKFLGDVVPILTELVPLAVKLGEAFLAWKVASVAAGALQTLGVGLRGAYMNMQLYGESAAASTAATSGLAGKIPILAGALLLLKQPFEDAIAGNKGLATQLGISDFAFQKINGELGGLSQFESVGDVFRGMTDPLASTTTRAKEAATAYAGVQAQLKTWGLSQDEINQILVDNIDSLDRQRDSISGWSDKMLAAGRVSAGWAARQKFAGIMNDQASASFEAMGQHVDHVRTVIHRFANMSAKDVQKWSSDTIKAFQDTFTTLAGAEQVFKGTSRQFIRDVQKMALNAQRAADDMKVLSHLDVPQAFERWLIDLGPNAVDKFVRANDVGRQKIIQAWRDDTAAAADYGKAVADVTKPRVSHITVQVDNGDALIALRNQIQGIEGIHTASVLVHTAPVSPWPDEALKKHLADPLKAMGFRKATDGWVLRAGVDVHSAMSVAGRAAGRDMPARGLAGIAAPTVPARVQRSRLDIHLDRRRFSDELSYDAVYRGWD